MRLSEDKHFDTTLIKITYFFPFNKGNGKFYIVHGKKYFPFPHAVSQVIRCTNKHSF